MKIIVNSDDKMRRAWTNLVQVESTDKALRMVENCREWFQHHPAGTYLVESQVNTIGAKVSYAKVSEKFAQKVMAAAEMDIEIAIRMMGEEVA